MHIKGEIRSDEELLVDGEVEGIVESGSRETMFTSQNPFVRQFLAGAEQGPLGME